MSQITGAQLDGKDSHIIITLAHLNYTSDGSVLDFM